MLNKDVITEDYKLLFGDCLERMKEIPDGSVDMILTDPPYGTTACKWDSVIPFEPMWAELKRIIKPNGAIVLFGSEPFSSLLRCSNLKMFKYDWVWVKDIAKVFKTSSGSVAGVKMRNCYRNVKLPYQTGKFKKLGKMWFTYDKGLVMEFYNSLPDDLKGLCSELDKGMLIQKTKITKSEIIL